MTLEFEGQKFQLVYQPKWDIRKRIVGVEALLRKEDSTSAVEVLNTALETGLTVDLTRSIIVTVADQMIAWQQKGVSLPISINVYVNDVSFELLEFIEDVFHQRQLPLMFLHIELLENQVIYQEKREILEAFKSKDIEIILDDFGGGVHTWGTIDEWQDVLDGVKLDKSVVDKGEALAFVDIILKKDLKVIVEGIEKSTQYKGFSSDVIMQGDYFSKSLPSEAFEKLVETTEISLY